jgi:hypothetical protein
VSLIAIAAQRELWITTHDWEAARRDESARGLSALKRALDDATRDGARRARAALEVAADSSRDRAFDEMSTVARGLDDGGVVVYRRDSAFAWAGDFRAPIDQVRDGTTIIATPFYLALQVTQRRGDDRAIVAAARCRPARRPIRFHARAAHRRSRRTQGVQIHSAE